MFNIFKPFIFTLAFWNDAGRWIGQRILPFHFYDTERIFVPPLRSSVDFGEIWPLAEMVTYPELDIDEELIFYGLNFARNVPDFKTCFPEVRLTGLYQKVWGRLLKPVSSTLA